MQNDIENIKQQVLKVTNVEHLIKNNYNKKQFETVIAAFFDFNTYLNNTLQKNYFITKKNDMIALNNFRVTFEQKSEKDNDMYCFFNKEKDKTRLEIALYIQKENEDYKVNCRAIVKIKDKQLENILSNYIQQTILYTLKDDKKQYNKAFEILFLSKLYIQKFEDESSSMNYFKFDAHYSIETLYKHLVEMNEILKIQTDTDINLEKFKHKINDNTPIKSSKLVL